MTSAQSISRAVIRALTLFLYVTGLTTGHIAKAQSKEGLDDAWWTGPLLAPSAATLPRGHVLIEPYLYDVTTQGQYDSHGRRINATHANRLGSLTYINYGLVDRLTLGLIPVFGYNQVSRGPSSSGLRFGDITLQAQYRIIQFHEGSWMPTISVAVQQGFPTGKYDRLGNRPSDALGSGAYSTTLAFYSQTYFWLPNGRILRVRVNLSPTLSSSVRVAGVSVYGTAPGFEGHAYPGPSIFVDAAAEYSLTHKWVIAMDATYRYGGNTWVRGYAAQQLVSAPVRLNLGASEAIGLAPAIEYNWARNLGVIVGARFIGPGRNTTATITPAVAINYVH